MEAFLIVICVIGLYMAWIMVKHNKDLKK